MKFKIDKVQAAIILGAVYIAMQLIAQIAAAKVIVLGHIIMDAGIIYALTFTWRDLIHKQLGKKAAQTTIILAGVLNLLMALYFIFVIKLPGQSEWIAAGGQKAFEFIFGLVPRIIIASIISQLISELVDTEVYQRWTRGIGKNKPQWTRVLISNAISTPLDSIIFPTIAFAGILSLPSLGIMMLSNLLIKAIVTIATVWMIYLVPEKKIYHGR